MLNIQMEANMKKFWNIAIIVLILSAIAVAIGFKINSLTTKYNEAKEATEIVAIEQLGEGCILLESGSYKNSYYPPGFWFGYVDEKKYKAIMFTAVPTFDGSDWIIKGNRSQTGGNPYNLWRNGSRW